MANIKSAKKRTRQIEKRTLVNATRRGSVKSAIKSVLKAIDAKGDAAKVKELFKDAESKIAKAKNKIMHQNTSARKIGRLAKKVAAYTSASK